jgi:hypothetical protein
MYYKFENKSFEKEIIDEVKQKIKMYLMRKIEILNYNP